MNFIHDDFLLNTKAARRLYHEFAAPQPILDYHNHLPPQDIASDRQFENLFEIWLEGDHYKWRAMRANGVEERLCTGDAKPREKFKAWAATVPHTLRNPLFHWTHLELKRHFDIDTFLGPDTADRIWDECSERLSQPEMSARGLLRKFNVKALCTTDDPAEELVHHKELVASDFEIPVYPAFRPDKALTVDQPEVFNEWIGRFENASDISITSFDAFRDAIELRHNDFHAIGSRISDHGLSFCYSEDCTENEAAGIFDRARAGKAASAEEHVKYASWMMFLFGQLDAARGWIKQLHLGALRNNSSRGFRTIGPDAGFDSIGDWPQAGALSRYLDRLDRNGCLPKTIVYNVNPVDNYALAAMVGNFQDGTVAGKIQFGSGWWFLDQKEGMEWQLNTLSNIGLLSRFIGMLTDSRSFMSFPRHEYFRRILCNVIGKDVENGIVPDDDAMLQPLIENICFENARKYLGVKVAG